jgi:RNA polymerase sigma-70 factor (ECF subfamily)
MVARSMGGHDEALDEVDAARDVGGAAGAGVGGRPAGESLELSDPRLPLPLTRTGPGRLDRAALQALFTRLADGDRAAIQPAYALLWPMVRRFTGRALERAEDAEDAAQEALLKVFARVSQIDGSREAIAWVLAIAAWECRTVRRRAARRGELDGERLDARAAEGATPEQELVAKQLAEAAREALSELRPEERRVILEAFAAERGRRPDGGVAFRKRLQRALERLRGAWRARHGAE